MELSDLKNIFNRIHEASENEKQDIIDDFLKNNNDLSFLASSGNSHFSYYSAMIISFIGFPNIKGLFPEILEWLQDLNWPGVYEIIETLKKADKEFILPHIENTLEQAIAEKDEMWIGGIKILVELMNISKNDFPNKEIYEMLELSDYHILA